MSADQAVLLRFADIRAEKAAFEMIFSISCWQPSSRAGGSSSPPDGRQLLNLQSSLACAGAVFWPLCACPRLRGRAAQISR